MNGILLFVETGDSGVSNGSCTEVIDKKKAVRKKAYSREEMFAVKKFSRAEKGKNVVVDGSEAENKNTHSEHRSTGKSNLSYSNKSQEKSFKNDKKFVNKVKPSSQSDNKQADGPSSHRGDRRTCYRCHEVGHVVYQCPMTSPSHAFVRSEVGPVVINHFKSEKPNKNVKNSKTKNTSVNVKLFHHVNVKQDLPKHSYQRKANTVNNVSIKPKSVKVVDLDFKKLSYYVKQSPFTSYHWVASTQNAKSEPEKVFDEKENVFKETEFVTPDKHVISEESVSSNKVDPSSSVNSDQSTQSVKSLDPEFSDSEKECFVFDKHVDIDLDKVTQDKPKRAWVSLFS